MNLEDIYEAYFEAYKSTGMHDVLASIYVFGEFHESLCFFSHLLDLMDYGEE